MFRLESVNLGIGTNWFLVLRTNPMFREELGRRQGGFYNPLVHEFICGTLKGSLVNSHPTSRERLI